MLFLQRHFSAIFEGSEFRCEGGKEASNSGDPRSNRGTCDLSVRLGEELEPKRVNPIVSPPFLYSALPISISSIFALTLFPVPARRDPCWDFRSFFVLSEKRDEFV